MIRISDKIWLKRDKIEGVYIDGNDVKVFIGNSVWVIEEKYRTDAISCLSIDWSDVISQIGRN